MDPLMQGGMPQGQMQGNPMAPFNPAAGPQQIEMLRMLMTLLGGLQSQGPASGIPGMPIPGMMPAQPTPQPNDPRLQAILGGLGQQ